MAAPMRFGQGNADKWQAEQPKGHIDPKDRLPVPSVNHRPADQRTERYTQAVEPAPDADCCGSHPLGYGGIQQGQRERHKGSAPHALDSAKSDEHPRLGAQRTCHGGECEEG